MAHWLFKSEPDSWSWDQQVAAGAQGTFWNGVRNHLAKRQLMAMQVGERGFFYHSNEGKAVVGIVEVIRPYYPDHTDESGRFGMVDVKAVEPLPRPVTLDAIKADPALADMVLVKNSRLSVQPVTDAEWERVRALGGLGWGGHASVSGSPLCVPAGRMSVP
ncbi:EVE domain-containing protein [Methylobacterium sp. sgz302541]|uniref:EVE domain-containing protein n=1 Tax=unclassified Methylobacterium TaxID=2615210 RepID=UPI003D34A197